MTLQWFLSRRVRTAARLCNQIQKILDAQRDLLSPEAIQNVQKAIADLRALIRGGADRTALQAQVLELEALAGKWLIPYPSAGLRENIDVLLVTTAVVFGVWTFFFKPFKIPTGSMQPTLYGITHENFINRPGVEFPGAFQGFFTYWYRGLSYIHIKARDTGRLRILDEQPLRVLVFNLRQRFQIGNTVHTIWFPPDNIFTRAGLADESAKASGRIFHNGEDVIKLKVMSGDYLFVERVTYNFRPPKRGEIVVFETRGVPGLPEDQFYIKRLVALGGETVRIGNDRHLIIDGKRLDGNTPHFENVYSFNTKAPPRESQYAGHVNEFVVRKYYGYGNLAPLFGSERQVQTVRPNHYMVMGDNTMNSSDSRTWGDFPRENVVGKCFFVAWPIGRQNGREGRFGWGTR
jgi:signal peptidase I